MSRSASRRRASSSIGSSRRTRRPEDLTERVEAWLERNCAEQGVPVKLSDPLALAEIAEILCSARENRDAEV